MKIVRKFFTTLAIISAFFSCNIDIQIKQGLEQSIEDLKKTDLAFSKMSVDSGIGKAFIQFADTGAYILRYDRFPVVGTDELVKAYSSPTPLNLVLIWEPVKAEIARSNDFGYTIGNWEMKTKTSGGADTVLYGNYLTVWKKQSDGSWKYVSDAGSHTPGPNKK